MKTKYNKSISLKSKLIFLSIPLIFLVVMELLARITISYLEKSETPDKISLSTNITKKEANLLKNFEIHKNETMCNLPFHCFDKDLIYCPKPKAKFRFKLPCGEVITYSINSIGFRCRDFQKHK